MAMGPNNPRGDGLYRPLAEINVTPLVDVMLVLLIIFMITAPLLSAGMRLNLPQSKAAQPLSTKEPIVISVSKEGKIAIGADEVAVEQLFELVKIRLGDDPAQVVHVRGDKEAAYGQVVQVVDTLAANGVTRIAIVTDRRPKPPAANAAP